MEHEIRHSVFTPIDLSDESDDGKPKWNMIAKPVKSRSHAAGDFELTTAMFHDAVNNFKMRSTKKLPINFDHFSPDHPSYDPNKGCPKQGNVVDLEVRSDGCLWGLTDFFEPAKTYIKEKKYEWFSPEILLDSLDRETGKRVGMRLKGVALVDDPHLYDMPKVRASNDERSTENPLTETPEADKTKKDSIMTKELELKVTELENKVREKDLAISTLTLEHKSKLAEIQANLDEKTRAYEKLEKEVIDGDVEVAFNTYKDARGLSDSDKTHLKVMRLANADSFRALFPVKAPAAAKPTPAVRAPVTRPAYVSANLSNEDRPATQEVKLSQSQLHDKYMKEGMDSNAAARRAAKEVRGNGLWHN